MSAWICTTKHINLLAHACIQLGVINEDEGQKAATDLYGENVKSVNYRYRSQEVYPPIKFVQPDTYYTKLDLIDVYKQMNCFDYQSCEHDGWETSSAKNLLFLLKCAIEQELGKTEDEICSTDEYGNGPWGIDS